MSGPVSAEVTALDYDGMIREGNELRKIAKNVAVKVPLTIDGLKACKALTGEGAMVNVTLCFSANQALLAAKAGATFISPFVGRLDDIHLDGMELIDEIRQIYDNYDFDTDILVASVRSANHVKEAALIGADVVTAPAAVLKALGQAPAHRQGHRTVPRRLEEDGAKHLIIEHAILDVKPERRAAYETALHEAVPLMAATPGFISMEVRPCLEKAGPLSAAGRVGDAGGTYRSFSRFRAITSGWSALLHPLLFARFRWSSTMVIRW